MEGAPKVIKKDVKKEEVRSVPRPYIRTCYMARYGGGWWMRGRVTIHIYALVVVGGCAFGCIYISWVGESPPT